MLVILEKHHVAFIFVHIHLFSANIFWCQNKFTRCITKKICFLTYNPKSCKHVYMSFSFHSTMLLRRSLCTTRQISALRILRYCTGNNNKRKNRSLSLPYESTIKIDTSAQSAQIDLQDVDVFDEVYVRPPVVVKTPPIDLTQRGEHGVFDVEELVTLLRSESIEDIVVCRCPDQYNYVDYFVIGTALSKRHLKAVSRYVVELVVPTTRVRFLLIFSFSQYNKRRSSRDAPILVYGSKSLGSKEARSGHKDSWHATDMGSFDCRL